ncbi:MAG: DNA polymerase I [Eubacteriales bacterium]
MKTLLIVDGNSVLYRAFYGIRPLTTKDALPTNAVYGMTAVLLKHLEQLRPDYAAVAFDLPAPTFRHIRFDAYKATRKRMPDEFAVQLPYARECIAAMGLAVIEAEGYEADDILGTLANTEGLICGIPGGVFTYILTGDRDSFQLIDTFTHVLLTGNNETVEYGEEEFRDKYGVEPSQFVDVKALMGDQSDNIPGVAGIGEKTALKLIAECGSLDNVYADIEAAPAGKSAKEKLAAGKDSAYLSRFLAKIKTDVPLALTCDDLLYTGINRTRLRELFIKLEFTAFIKRLSLAEDADEKSTAETAVPPAAAVPTPEILSAVTEAAFIINDSTAYIYDGQRTLSCPICDLDHSFFESSERKFIVYNLKHCRSVLYASGIDFAPAEKAANVFDIMLAAYVLNPSDSAYNLPRLAMAYLNRTYDGSPTADSVLLYDLKQKIEPLISEYAQSRLLAEIELPLASVLFDMERTGFKVDTEGLTAFSAYLGKIADMRTEEIYAMTGELFNINSPKQLGEVLFEKLGLPPPKKTKTGYSTAADVLEKLRPYSPVIDKIFEYRQVVKLKSTYADGLRSVADKDGRIHTSFNQTVASTGRLSSTEPNLQNIPIRQELGRELRRYFIPENENYLLIDADYSQIELRLLACISEDERMIRAFAEGDDIHAITASQVFGVPLDEVTPELRKRAKAVNFGIVYGIGDFSLAADIGVSRYEAGEYIKSYFAKYPGVDAYMKRIKESAKRDGYVATLFGRRRYIPELASPKAMLRAFGERVAMNSPIQGTAADIIKLAMINTARALSASSLDAHLILQVHDELIVECNRDCAKEAAGILRREMEGAVTLAVPLSVDISAGSTWYDQRDDF